ncbi:MAG: hypothetical protein M0C28_41530 [Candidatus Moduliflexus flocculans]|nr:hypothetical protein [Candidatus Moduliflexus flocculans]
MFGFINDLFWLVKGVRVFALVGESGTGKSFRAKLVAQKYGIDMHHRRRPPHPGRRHRRRQARPRRSSSTWPPSRPPSSTTRPTATRWPRPSSARRFQQDPRHRHLGEAWPRRSAERLQLPHPSKIIKIEDIASREEIEKAIRSRKVEGKHVIPVPAIEVQAKLSPHLLRLRPRLPQAQPRRRRRAPPARSTRSRWSGRSSPSGAGWPSRRPPCPRWSSTASTSSTTRIRIKKITVRVRLARATGSPSSIEVPFGTQLSGNIHDLQQYIIDNIERFTGILIEEVNIVVERFGTGQVGAGSV